MKSEKVAEILNTNIAWLEKLPGEDIAGFAVIVPPEGEPIEIRLAGTSMTAMEFYKYMADRCAARQQDNPYGGQGSFIRTPGIR